MLARLLVISAAAIALTVEGSATTHTFLTQIEIKMKARIGPKRDGFIEVILDEKREREAFPADWLLFVVLDSAGRTVAAKPFHSSYQQFRIDAVDLDGDGVCEYIFTTGQGRGTSVRQESLSIERLHDGMLQAVVSAPISDYYSSGKRWWYSVNFRDTDGNGTIDVELRLKADNPSGFLHAPQERVKIFQWVSGSKIQTKMRSY